MKIVQGINDLATQNPKLASEWDYDKNEITPSDVGIWSKKKVWWKCQNNHSYEASIFHRSEGTGCPFCCGKLPVVGETDLETLHPEIAKEWHPSKNEHLLPSQVTAGSGKMVWWQCEKGHEWKTSVKDRVKGTNCPYCYGRFAIHGETDLETLYPEIAKEWHPTKNGELFPSMVTSSSNKKVWWQCEKGHEWQATINHRYNGTKCPFCSGLVVSKGETDLETLYPEIAKEWHPTKNGIVKPYDALPFSNKLYWWKCEKGHKWKSTVNNRVKGNGCPLCSAELRTSFPEYAIMYYLINNSIEAIQSYQDYGFELDIYIPSFKIGIEYDGYYWHKDKVEGDIQKNNLCLKNNVFLFRIREEGLPELKSSSKDYFVDKNQSNLSIAIKEIISKILDKSVDVDVDRDRIKIEQLINHINLNNSLEIVNPKLAAEWHPTKNGCLKPCHVLPNSGKKVWWKCENGHEWQATIYNRNNSTGCPFCNNKRLRIGVNDLKTLNPPFSSEWDYEKNDVSPSLILGYPKRKVWWKCKRNHSFLASIDSRHQGRCCPICSGKIIDDSNNLEANNPKLAAEWNFERNEKRPSEYAASSHKIVWWKCGNGHEWQARIADRNRGRGCPYCSKSRKRKFINCETREIFDSITKASRTYKIKQSDISECCKGLRETAGGFHWNYYEK